MKKKLILFFHFWYKHTSKQSKQTNSQKLSKTLKTHKTLKNSQNDDYLPEVPICGAVGDGRGHPSSCGRV
jgi:hypothetical protein